MPLAKSLHTVTALAVLEALQSYLRQYDDGLALPQASYVLSRDPLTIRQPDVSILSKDRVRATPSDEFLMALRATQGDENKGRRMIATAGNGRGRKCSG